MFENKLAIFKIFSVLLIPMIHENSNFLSFELEQNSKSI